MEFMEWLLKIYYSQALNHIWQATASSLEISPSSSLSLHKFFLPPSHPNDTGSLESICFTGTDEPFDLVWKALPLAKLGLSAARPSSRNQVCSSYNQIRSQETDCMPAVLPQHPARPSPQHRGASGVFILLNLTQVPL